MKRLQKSELRGAGKMLWILWDNSYYSMGKKASERLEVEMIYYFGKNWAKTMLEFIEEPHSAHIIKRLFTLKELKSKPQD